MATVTLQIKIGRELTDVTINKYNRSIRIGTDNFTKAIQEKFKLIFKKAEVLRHEGKKSKYAREICNSYNHIFLILVSELQRDLGFYNKNIAKTKDDNVEIAEIIYHDNIEILGLKENIEQGIIIPVTKSIIGE